jgi:hypothetical protein
MRLKLFACQVLTREIGAVISRSAHSIDAEIVPMGLHDMGASMRQSLQERIDAADSEGYDAMLLGYALCGRGTEGLRVGKTQLVLPRAHDCIGLLMGSRDRFQSYFDSHSGVYFRSPGWIENQAVGGNLQPAYSAERNSAWAQQTREQLIGQYGVDNGNYLFEQFSAYRCRYTRLAYISTGVEADEACRSLALAEADREGWTFEEIEGSLTLLERLVDGDWDEADFLVAPPGASIRVSLGESIVEAL